MAGSMFTEKKEVNRISKAICNNDIEELKKALADGEDPHFKDRKQNTYLHYVCTMHRPFIIHIIIGTGIDLNAQNRHGNTALHVTALQSECCHVGDLMAAGLDPNIKNKSGLTAAEIPAKNAFWKTIYDQYAPGIFEAIAQHDVDKVVYLLHCWSRVDTARAGQTLRQFAACRKFHDIVYLVDSHRHTLGAIYSILEGDAKSAATYLAHSKCDVNFVNYAAKNTHILQYALKLGDLCIVKMICKAKINVSLPVTIHRYLKAPLFFSVLNPQVPSDIMWAILKAGPDFTKTDERGRNAAIYALDKTERQISLEVIAFMLKNGLDVSQRDASGVTVRDVARFAKRQDILTLLDKVYIKLLRTSDMQELERLCFMGYDSMLIDFNYRDSFIYASGNETEEVVDFIQWIPKFYASVRKFHYGVCHWSSGSIEHFLTTAHRPDLLINARDKGGRAAIHLCVLHWRSDVLKLLLEQENIDVNACDSLGRSALHYACSVEEEEERNEFCYLLKRSGANTELKDNFYHKPQEYVENPAAIQWLKKEKKTQYGMVKQLACVDKYEELAHMMKYKGKGLKHFNKTVCRFRYPVPKFAEILSPLMPEYRDLVFIAMDKGKEEIAVKLVQLGTDWRRREMCEPLSDTSDEEKEPKLMSVKERAEQLGMTSLLNVIESKMEYLQKKHVEASEIDNQEKAKLLSGKMQFISKSRKNYDSESENGQTPSLDENGDVVFEEEFVENEGEEERADNQYNEDEDQENYSNVSINIEDANDHAVGNEEESEFDDIKSYSEDTFSSGDNDDSDPFDLFS